ncbi:phospholipase D family protein [Moritella sp. Urea-trap-13]|uniref:phospholipase D family protein n=1 Tax=Moritella sp. Urea-trap-13 TaxID=2058327 RepID=UPI000C335EB2|nr:phospholipase D family protein [Moritella sp. Urea-trap-13]PKH04784.1 phospholipase D family protein [Moritella sp. Urea-trap-13]
MPVLQRISVTLLLITTLAGCASLPEEIEHPTEPLVTQPASSLSALIDTHKPEHTEPGQDQAAMSGVLLLDSGWDALAQRLALIETAEHSIDIQYYIWNSDGSGSYLASRLLAAADRGVKVRVMLDDINLNEREALLATLDRHPQIAIRIFNPIPTRNGFTKWFNFMGDFSRLNRRMHNKSFTVDGALSIVGGRNIGDEYFDLSDDINFRDRDVLVSGSVVNDIEASFGQYWNSQWSYPVNLLSDDSSSDNSSKKTKAPVEFTMLDEVPAPHYKHYPPLPTDNDMAKRLLNDSMAKLSWVQARFVFDRPVPIDTSDTNKPKLTAKTLGELAVQSKQEILLESAYLIFDDRQLAAFQTLTDKGVQIKTLTNSQASNDLVTNHSGYAARREDMLDSGIQLFELKPESNLCEASTKDLSKCAPIAAYGLHAKSAVFDRKIAVIGSFNYNLRSTYLNTESILIIENKAVAISLANDIEQAMNADNSWSLDLNDGDIRWHSATQDWDSDPETSQWQRFKSGFLQLLPIEKYL